MRSCCPDFKPVPPGHRDDLTGLHLGGETREDDNQSSDEREHRRRRE